jgi:hypothetical protein
MAPGAARFLTKNACFTGPIAEKVDERVSSVTAASRPRTKTVRASCAVVEVDGDADGMQDWDRRATPARRLDKLVGMYGDDLKARRGVADETFVEKLGNPPCS